MNEAGHDARLEEWETGAIILIMHTPHEVVILYTVVTCVQYSHCPHSKKSETPHILQGYINREQEREREGGREVESVASF